ncbi:MAG: carboxypeptidase-like regulatory domain-containing protein [Bacteroidetes bacterium]|nr:carboxypeptidase-like regulatory domain-containing protein [Bacteroidota bacterium]
MKKIVLYILLLSGPVVAQAQFDKLKDSVVQVFGFVMTADSLQGIPAVSISVHGRHQGTISNDQGVFSITVLKGDIIEFSSIGYKSKVVEIPRNIDGNQYSMIQLLITDTTHLAVTIIRPRPTRQQFERDFVNTKVPDDDIEIARQNTEAAKRRILLRALPADAREATNTYLRQNATRFSYLGQAPPQNIFNPLAWADFIQAWKRGDFKNNN